MARTGGCAQCASGRFAAASGAKGCTSCAEGRFQDEPGQTGCKACNLYCPAGYFYSECGQSESGRCLRCSRGQFSTGGKDPTCETCAAGTYQAKAGQGKCAVCPEGQYQDRTGQSRCRRVANCHAQAQYEAKTPTASSNRVCKWHTACSRSQYEAVMFDVEEVHA